MNRHSRRAESAGEHKAPDPFKIFINAERYRLADRALRSMNGDPQFMASISGPAMVLAAFASELYFKCLIVIENKRPNEIHNLQKLFSILDRATQKSIEVRWDAWADQPERKRIYEMMENHFGGKQIRRDLAWTLRSGGEGFHTLRYLHENEGSSSSFFLGELHELLRQEIVERKPQWNNMIIAPGKPLAGNIYDPPGSPFDRS